MTMRCRGLCVLAVAMAAAAGTLAAQDHGYTPADIESGGRLYQASCAGCHGPGGEQVPGVELARGQFRRGTSDTDLISIVRAGIPGTAMPPHGMSDQEAAQVVAFLRNMSAVRTGASPTVLRRVGDPVRGRALFEGRGGCTTCHRVQGRGPRLAPDLTEVGATRPLAELREAVLEPQVTIRAGNRLFRAVTTDGRTITGRLLNQDSFSIQMLDAAERLVSLSRSDLREHDFVRTSPMPSVRDTFTMDEIDDLVGYLASLKGFNR
jgi:putative heme-binding domain-containing protein